MVIRTLSLLMAIGLVVASCGGSDEQTAVRTQDGASTTTDSPVEATAPTTTSAPITTVSPTIREGTVMQLVSSEFGEGDLIPTRFSCDGEDISPPLTISDIPDDAVALVLIMDDPDAPGGTWDHWVAFDIPPTPVIIQGVGSIGVGGVNSWGRTGYGGPCPPSGTHRYVFRVLALSSELGLAEGATKEEVLEAAAQVTMAEATLMGRYAR